MKVSITTLGCRSNQYDSAAIEGILKENNFEVNVSKAGSADVCIINTCTVTGKTDYQSRQLIRRAAAANPDAVILVTGCYAQISAQEIAGIKGVDYILGNPEKEMVLQYILKGKRKYPKIEVGKSDNGKALTMRARGYSNRTRANLKVQDGCNNSCSYCIIPKARGISRSLPVSAVMKEIDDLIENGYKEIILTGIHLGAYGQDLNPKTNIAHLINIIETRNYPCRFRISSLDPDELSDELIEAMAKAGTICNHLHLPLQSGDVDILRMMNRRYTAGLFAERIKKIAKRIPEISIGVDVIVGFPGEGEKEFLNTYSLLNDLPIAYMHIFPFSKRKGTAAAGFSNQVDAKIVRQRCESLKKLDEMKRKNFYQGFLGKRASVLLEASRDKDTGFLTGRSRNYMPFLVNCSDEFKNLTIDVTAGAVRENGILGMIEGGAD